MPDDPMPTREQELDAPVAAHGYILKRVDFGPVLPEGFVMLHSTGDGKYGIVTSLEPGDTIELLARTMLETERNRLKALGMTPLYAAIQALPSLPKRVRRKKGKTNA